MELSIRAYARHRGVSHVAVIKAIGAGRITQERNGTINPEQADREWEQNTASPRKRSSMQNQATESIQPTLSANGTSLLQARTVNEVVKAQTNKVRLAAKLDVDPHAMHVALEATVREHLQELGELRPRVD